MADGPDIVSLSVTIHHVQDIFAPGTTAEVVKNHVDTVLRSYIDLDYESSLDVEIDDWRGASEDKAIEHVGTAEDPKSEIVHHSAAYHPKHSCPVCEVQKR